MDKFLLRFTLVVVLFPLYAFIVALGAIFLIALSLLLSLRFIADWECK